MTKKEIQKTNKRKIKSYREQLKSEIFDVENELIFSDMEEAQIDCKIGKTENIFSPFDIAQNRTISENFHHYLMQEVDIVPVRHNIEIRLHLDSQTTVEQEEQIKKAIKRYYSYAITKINVKLKDNLVSALLLYFGGIISLIANMLSVNWITILPIYETLLIATWFFVWEGTNVAFFDRTKLKQTRYDMLRIYNAKLTTIRELVEN